jgi:uncharacterized membrane protein
MTRVAPVVSAGLLLGAGLGGFLDGILLHQLLQWHNMLSSVVPATDLVTMKLNMLWDGVFHALTWLVTVAGVCRLWAVARRPDALLSTPALAGGLLIGWGLFNSVEGLIDHHLFGIHHVHPGEHQLAWDVGFVCSGAALGVIGWSLIRSSLSRSPAVGKPHAV